MPAICRNIIIPLCLVVLCRTGFAQQEIPLYDAVPDAKPSDIREKIEYAADGNVNRVSDIRNPRLIVFRPENPCGTSIILCPGGGYKSLNTENTRFIARRLNKVGITAFVLIYRVPNGNLQEKPSVAGLQDVQEAFRLVRRQAASFGLSPDKVGLWGSSAGGHLAAMAATHYTEAFEPQKNTIGLRPDFLVLAWPVVSFRSEYAHKGSMRNLLGERPSESIIEYFSPENAVDGNTPPTFLVHAADDPSVSPENSILFYRALKKANAAAETHIYEKSEHGFGIAPDIKDSWMSQLFVWLRERKLIN